MTNYIAVFRSKTDVFLFLDIMRSRGVYSTITATPKEAGIGCGLAARFPSHAISVARAAVQSGRLPSFYSFYSVYRSGNGFSIMKIN